MKRFERVHRHAKRRREERKIKKLDIETFLVDKKAYARRREAKYLSTRINVEPPYV